MRAFNPACVELPGYEADDLIATLARRAHEAGAGVTVVYEDEAGALRVDDRPSGAVDRG